MSQNRVISFSLYGTAPKYLVGAVCNVADAARFYPGWICRFYVREDVPRDVCRRLEALGATIVPRSALWFGEEMFWRFEAIDDPSADVVLIRDADSRFSFREQLAVFCWLRSNSPVHVMRDHPAHNMPIPGGMWGARFGAIQNLRDLIEEWRRTSRRYAAMAEQGTTYGMDQVFLTEIIWPLVKSDVYQHDEFYRWKWSACAWPSPVLPDGHFVGEVYDENNQPRMMDRTSRRL